MKILHINQNYVNVGGTENYIKSLKNVFQQKNHEIFLFGIDEKRSIKTDNIFVYKNEFKDGFRNIKHGFKKYIYWFYFNPELYFELKKWIEEINPDIIHIHNIGKFTNTILFVLNSFNIPVVQTIHDPSLFCPTALCFVNNTICKGGYSLKCYNYGCVSAYRYLYEKVPVLIRNKMLKLLIKRFIAPSKALKMSLNNNGFNNVIHLSNFIDTNSLSSKYNQNNDDRILYVGRLSKEKGVEYLIRAIPLIIKKRTSCVFDIVGDGPLKSYIQNLVKELKLEKYVNFHGNVDNQIVQKMYEHSKIIVVPSVWLENSPIVIYEAMYCGKIIIASNIGGIPDLITNLKTGILVEPGNENDIAEKILYVLSNNNLGKKLSETARRTCIEKYNPQIHYDKIHEIYSDLIN